MTSWWRRPVAAPVYAAVTAFAMVLVLGAVLPADQATAVRDPATVIRVVLANGGALPEELTGLPVEMLGPSDAQPVRGALSQGSYTLSGSLAAGRQVCARVPDPWRVTDPPLVTVGEQACTAPLPDPPGTEVVLKVARGVRVQARTKEDKVPDTKDVTVKIRDLTNSAIEESGPLDGTDGYLVRRSLTNQEVCLKTPAGLIVTSPKAEKKDGLYCTADPERTPTGDVVFTVERG
jgi:hypothetical protein